MSIGNMSKSQDVYSLIKKGLTASALRGRVIANNIANVNTKGYKRRYVTFEENLKESMDNVDMKTTNTKHIDNGNSNGSIKVEQDNSTSMRQDGNNVDIDNEMVNEAANSMMYNALISQVNSRISMERYVVSEGRK